MNKEKLGEKCGISGVRWNELKDYHDVFFEIYEDFKSRYDEFSALAVNLSAFLQNTSNVHSVRWRVKSPEHLIVKICRKLEAGSEKYKEINVDNYRNIVTDLIGVRVLHLFKADFPEIHSQIMSKWEVLEEPKVYLRSGDLIDELKELYEGLGISVETHESGYRSIHYIIVSGFTKEKVNCELQVRTVFEEGWSEVDHEVRYPEFSNEPLVVEFLNIFNRLSGAADEMGGFVKKLAQDISQMKVEASKQEEKIADAYEELESGFKELEGAHKNNRHLRAELKKMRLAAERTKKKGRFDMEWLNSISADPSEIHGYGLKIKEIEALGDTNSEVGEVLRRLQGGLRDPIAAREIVVKIPRIENGEVLGGRVRNALSPKKDTDGTKKKK